MTAKCDVIAELRAKVEELEAELFAIKNNAKIGYDQVVADLRTELTDEQSKVKVLTDALEELACLGNGDTYGNSVGNCIAIKALAAIKEK